MDDYFCFTWVKFLKSKSETVKVCIHLDCNLQREKGHNIIRLQSDHGKEFENEELDLFCESEGISHEYSAPITHNRTGLLKERIVCYKKWPK